MLESGAESWNFVVFLSCVSNTMLVVKTDFAQTAISIYLIALLHLLNFQLLLDAGLKLDTV
jgi:hypothetical protein